MRHLRALHALGALFAVGALLGVAGCATVADATAGPAPRAEQVATPESARAAATADAGAQAPQGTLKAPASTVAEAATDEPEADDGAAMTYGEAYDLLYEAITPSDLLIDEWNVAAEAEDWAVVRTTSGRLADCLQTLQVKVLAAAWPADAQAAAQAFALALDQEIGWYSYVSIATGDDATVDALGQPWTDAAVTASDELWTILEAGLVAEG